MKTIEESREGYLNSQLEIKKVNDRIEQRLDQIVRLKNKIGRLYDKSFWGNHLIPPIMELVKEKFPLIKWDDDEGFTPMGLCNRVSLFGKIEDKTIILCFTPSNLQNGIIAYDTEERKGEYPKGSMGDLNHMNKVSEDITSIEQIYIHIEKQLN